MLIRKFKMLTHTKQNGVNKIKPHTQKCKCLHKIKQYLHDWMDGFDGFF